MKFFKISAFVCVLVLITVAVFDVNAAAKQPKSVSRDSDYIQSSDVPKVVQDLFQQVFHKKINREESDYWKKRARTDKTGVSKLKSAMFSQKSKGGTTPKVVVIPKKVTPTPAPAITPIPTSQYISNLSVPSLYLPYITNRNTITIAYERSGCSYFITAGNIDYQLMEWFGGNLPNEGDIYYGDPNGFGFKDFYNATGKIHVWVDDYFLSANRAVQKYFDKCY